MPVASRRVLVTGGAGFIGSHVVDLLLAGGWAVTVLDCLERQVHGKVRRPAYLDPRAEFIYGRVQDRGALRRALKGVSSVVHLAAQVGVGQSMYEIERYVADNCLATAILLEEVLRPKARPRRLIVASSMSIYGEGAYRCSRCGPVFPSTRSVDQLKSADWEMRCPVCFSRAAPEGASEAKPLAPTSVYAVTKRDQEELCLAIGRAYNLPTIAFRFFNVYGPRQSLSNPYTGVAAIFASRLLNGKAPLVFEDGLQSRDFVHVTDIAQAIKLGLERTDVPFGVFNIGTGVSTSVLDVARSLARALGRTIEPRVLGTFRQGDIRHCFGDIRNIRRGLGFEPRVKFQDGISDLLSWLTTQRPVDKVEKAYQELKVRGLAE